MSMKSLYAAFQTDPELEQKGITLDYGFCKIKIARAGGSNKRFSRIVQTLFKPIKRQMDTGIADPDKVQDLMADAYAQGVVLGWESPVKDEKGNITGWVPTLEDAEGNKMEFTRDNCIKLFTDLPDLFADIQEQAQKAALFRQIALEEDAGNF